MARRKGPEREKDKAAQDLGRKRWVGVSREQRSEHGRRAARLRWPKRDEDPSTPPATELEDRASET